MNVHVHVNVNVNVNAHSNANVNVNVNATVNLDVNVMHAFTPALRLDNGEIGGALPTQCVSRTGEGI